MPSIPEIQNSTLATGPENHTREESETAMDEITITPILCPECKEFTKPIQLKIYGRLVWVCELCGQALFAFRNKKEQTCKPS